METDSNSRINLTVSEVLATKFRSMPEITYLTPNEQRALCDQVARIANVFSLRARPGVMSPRQIQDHCDALSLAAQEIRKAAD